MQRIVLDTNCLISSLSRSSDYYNVWYGLHKGKYMLCVSNEILTEYQEIIAKKTTPLIAENVIQFLINSAFVEFVTPYFHFNLITSDPDDNKFVDCAIASNAKYIVSNDKHYNILKEIPYPKIDVITIQEFLDILQK